MQTPPSPPAPTPPGGRWLPGVPVPARDLRRLGARPSVLLGLVLMVTAAAARRTAGQIRAMREAGLSVPALDHDVTLSGRGRPLRLTVIGDSAAAGHGLPDADAGLARQVGRRLAARTGRPVEVASLAVDGATTADLAEQQIPAIDGDADVVLVGVGVNDAVRGRSRSRARAATEALLEGVAGAAPGAVIVLLTCPDLASAPGMPALLRPALGRSCRRVASAQRAAAAAVGAVTVGAEDHLPAAAFGPDGFHPGPLGIAVLADRVDIALGSRIG